MGTKRRKLAVTKIDGNWVMGKYLGQEFSAKLYTEPSSFGINGGRVSKFWYLDISYERGWDTGEDQKSVWEPLVAELETFAQSERFAKELGI